MSLADKEVNIAFEGMGAAGATFGGLGNEFDWDAYHSTSFTAINDSLAMSVGSHATVSPKDIFNDPLASAPPSTAFTNLTSPDINESPYVAESYETSPIFQQDGANIADNWYSLFPEEDKPVSEKLERTVSTQSPARSSSSDSTSPIILDTASSRRKSPNNSPALVSHSSVSGVKPRRRKGPLPPITVDPSDKTALKRARNTLAARDSRQRKVDHVQSLEKRIAELEKEAEKWKAIATQHGYSTSS